MNSEPNLTREEAIAILNTPDEQLNELIERAGALRKKYKGNHVSIHLLTNARSGNCSQNCAYCAQSCRSHADIEKYKWVDDEKLYGDNTFVHDHKLSRHCIGLSGMKFSDEEIDKRVRESAALVGLKEKHLTRSPFDLSGGQKRRVAIAGVLAMNPKVLILDEPTAGLDPKGRDEILATIKKLHEENKEMIIIFVSHSMEDVAKTAERVIVMNDGHVEMQGTVAEVFAQAEHLQKIGLNVPQVTLLTDKLRLAGYDLPEHIYTVKYAADAIKKLIGGGGNV